MHAEAAEPSRPPGAGDAARGLAGLLGNKSHVFVHIDPSGEVVWASPSWRPVLGHDPAEVAGRNVLDFLHPDDVTYYLGALVRFLEPTVADRLSVEDAGLTADVRVRHADGRWRTLEVVSTIYFDDDDQVEGVTLIGHDVSERRHLDSSLLAMAGDATRADAVEEVLRYVDHHLLETSCALWVPEGGGSTWISASLPRALQVDQPLWARLVAERASVIVDDLSTTDEVEGTLVARARELGFRACWAFSIPSHDLADRVDGPLPEGLADPAACLVVWSRRHHEPFVTHWYALQLVDTYLTLALQRRRHDLELQRAANVDPLTGVLSRAGLERLAATDAPLATSPVLLIDLDGFKAVNDRLGHQAGDVVLSEIALRIGSQVRDGDLVCRLGGDEFVVALRDSRAAEVTEVADRLVHAIGAPLAVAGQHVTVSASIGIALPGPDVDLEHVLVRADRAMYAAKRDARERWVVDDGERSEPTG